ncbi:MAG TPA: ABC transporter ATP-binding protein [Candidatus Acidoferrales bacterium]|nr:ABC transporter ATP-binding protein [Candidatus Acidoferrales bacterium]
MSLLDVDDVSLAYRRPRSDEQFFALANVSLGVERGEFVTIVGPSGCGKSSLLMLIAALLRPTSGAIRLNGREVKAPGSDRAMVFQDFALLPWRTVLRNVELGMELKGLSPAERRTAAERYIAMVGLRDFERHFPHQLSGGMRQRVGIARALSVEPEVLLMDEPFGALDAQIRALMAVELLKIWERDRKTIVFITHDIDEAVYLADRVIVMSASPGRIIETIPVALPRPRDLDVRNSPEFAVYRHKIWSLLEEQVRSTLNWPAVAS